MYKIAIVDDEYDILEVLKKFLSRSGRYNISTYLNPKIAVESIDDTYEVCLITFSTLLFIFLTLLTHCVGKNIPQISQQFGDNIIIIT